jgi:hypothetical protein
VNDLENLNFLPRYYKERYFLLAVKKFKAYIFILWILCILLFLLSLHSDDKIKKLENNIQSNIDSNVDQFIRNKNESKKRNRTFTTFEEFLESLNSYVVYNSIIIADRQINLDLIAESKFKYYETVEKIESLDQYKILSLTPLYEENGALKFKILLEAKN